MSSFASISIPRSGSSTTASFRWGIAFPERKDENVTLTMEQAKSALMCFAKENKPIREGGPALLYLADGSNKDQPIDYLTELEVVKLT
jgi:hypothetical protein